MLGYIAVGVVGHRITGDHARGDPREAAGWECLYVAIDDASRVAYAELQPDETAASAVAFLGHGIGWRATLAVPFTA